MKYTLIPIVISYYNKGNFLLLINQLDFGIEQKVFSYWSESQETEIDMSVMESIYSRAEALKFKSEKTFCSKYRWNCAY